MDLVPTPEELGGIFDELEVIGQLSPDSWLVLRRLAFSLGFDNPNGYGCLICRPDPEEFDPTLLEDQLSEYRFEELVEGGDEPTPEEIAAWQEAHMELASADAAGGLYTTLGWDVRDDKGRQRWLVTLHVDRGSFEQVAGLFRSREEAAVALKGYGSFEWMW